MRKLKTIMTQEFLAWKTPSTWVKNHGTTLGHLTDNPLVINIVHPQVDTKDTHSSWTIPTSLPAGLFPNDHT